MIFRLFALNRIIDPSYFLSAWTILFGLAKCRIVYQKNQENRVAIYQQTCILELF